MIFNIQKLATFILIIFFSIACSKNENPIPDPPEPQKPQYSKGLFICNEGNFMYGNASLSYYNIETQTITNQIFFTTNNAPLGDVCQSMNIIDGKGYVVVNNSGKVQVIDTTTFKYCGTITGLNSPRYIEKIDNNKLYITDLYSPIISIIDPATLTKKGEINVGRSTEMMARVDNYIYTTSWSFQNKVYKIDTRTDSVIDSLEVTMQPNSIVADKFNNIWVLSDGGYAGTPAGQERATLTRIKTNTFTIDYIYELPTDESSPTKLCTDGLKENLYFINGAWGGSVQMGGICKVTDIDSTSPKVELIIPEKGRLFYGLGVDPRSSEIYISDAIDFTQKGVVYRYSNKGELVHQFQADLIPGYFCFK
ncbi:MAG: YncE family protein [Bacteroidales bacterium]|nr:YncE family protein [Bacteroidales bacterium]